jgi:prepilin-type processing-associated H-X9-DG protein
MSLALVVLAAASLYEQSVVKLLAEQSPDARVCYLFVKTSTGEILGSRWPDAARPVAPGSLVKAFTAIAYAETHAGRFAKAVCRGKASGCWLPRGHGEIDVEKAVAHSCNAYFRVLAAELRMEDVRPIAERYGLEPPPMNTPSEALVGLGGAWKITPAALARARESAQRSSCANNLKQFGLVCKMYSNESKGQKWPPMKGFNCDGTWEMDFNVDGTAVYPEYLNDPAILICPSDSRAAPVEDFFWDANDNATVPIDRAGTLAPTAGVPNKEFYGCEIMTRDVSYLYFAHNTTMNGITMGVPDVPQGTVDDSLSWIIGNNPMFFDMMSKMFTVLNNGSDIPATDDDIKVDFTGAEGEGVVYRLREGIERFMITDINDPAASALAQSEIAVSLDFIDMEDVSTTNHVPGGCNVLYLDGHVQFLKYPSIWPANRYMAFANAVQNHLAK